MSEKSARQRVTVLKGGQERSGTVVEVYRESVFGSLLGPDQGRVSALRIWLDGEPQPEIEMRKPSELL